MLDRVLRQFFSIGSKRSMKARVVGGVVFINVVAMFWRAG
jgi:hypothetical protein